MKKHLALSALLALASSGVLVASAGGGAERLEQEPQASSPAPIVAAPAPSTSPALLALPAPPDCQPTGQKIVEITTGPTTSDCVTTEYWDQCPDGSWVLKKTENCELYQLVTTTTTIVKIDSEGNDCSEVRVREETEHVGSTSKELGEVCPVDPEDCCVVTEHGWYYEWGAVSTSFAQSALPIECRDGTFGTQTTSTTFTWQARRVVTWSKGVPSGNCGPEVDCGLVEVPDAWIDVLIKKNEFVTDDCD